MPFRHYSYNLRTWGYFAESEERQSGGQQCKSGRLQSTDKCKKMSDFSRRMGRNATAVRFRRIGYSKETRLYGVLQARC